MDTFIFIVNILGTVAFAASGAMTGLRKNMDLFGVCLLGLTTAVGGGVLRDMMAGVPPYILVKHVYACASVAGAVSCVWIYRGFGQIPAMVVSPVVVILIRFLAVRYHWNLPHIKPE